MVIKIFFKEFDMKGNTMNSIFTILAPLALGVVAAVIAYSGLTGRALPMIAGPRPALIALLLVGFATCAFGILQVSASGRWASPPAIVGYLLGVILLAILISIFTGWKLPLIQNDTQAIVIVACMMAVKFLIGTSSYFFHLL